MVQPVVTAVIVVATQVAKNHVQVVVVDAPTTVEAAVEVAAQAVEVIVL